MRRAVLLLAPILLVGCGPTPPQSAPPPATTMLGQPAAGASPAAGMVRDVVCGMDVDPKTTPHKSDHAGRTYYFCCGGCDQKFAKDPEKYLQKRPGA